MKGRVLRCPKCGAGEGDIHFTCEASVVLEVADLMASDGSFSVNHEEVYGLHEFRLRCLKCGRRDVAYGEQTEKSTKALMREWSEEVED